tara:strand:- start:503 stop:1030 length:528 start_codon:yes stop_codon:yes gene_type:complete
MAQQTQSAMNNNIEVFRTNLHKELSQGRPLDTNVDYSGYIKMFTDMGEDHGATFKQVMWMIQEQRFRMIIHKELNNRVEYETTKITESFMNHIKQQDDIYNMGFMFEDFISRGNQCFYGQPTEKRNGFEIAEFGGNDGYVEAGGRAWGRDTENRLLTTAMVTNVQRKFPILTSVY